MKAGTGRTKRKSPLGAGAVEPTHDEIAVHAYERFLERGQHHGHDEEDWLKAEAEIRRKRNLGSLSAQRMSGVSC
jgi:DUF2934 family protein